MAQLRQNSIREYAKLLRLYALPVISIIPIIGLLTLMDWHMISPGHILALLLIGMFTHIFGHVLNEYMDIEIDRQSVELSKKPLVSGAIPKLHALAISVLALNGAIFTCWFFFHDILVMSLLMVALLCAGLYNLLHKKVPGSDIFIASAVLFSYLFGASTSLMEFGALTYYVGILLFIRELYANSIESALKDVEHEAKIGIKTVPLLLGVRVSNGTLVTPRMFKAYVFGIESMFLIALFAGLYYFRIGNLLGIAVLIIMISILFYAKMGYLNMKSYHREELKKYLGVHEVLAFCMVITILFLFIGMAAAILVFVSVICSIALMFMVYRAIPMI